MEETNALPLPRDGLSLHNQKSLCHPPGRDNQDQIELLYDPRILQWRVPLGSIKYAQAFP